MANNGKFGPADTTTRAQMATFVTRAVKGSPFKDPNLYTYALTSDFKVDQGMMYLKDASGKWFIPSETHFSNQTIMSTARGLLDKDRYVLLNYLKGDTDIPNRVLLTYSTSANASRVGLSPFSSSL